MNIEQTIRDYLPKIVHMSLGTSKDNKPWVCEVHFAYDKDLNLYFRSLSSRRHSQEIAANPHVAGNIVFQHPLGQYPLGVYFEGTAELQTADDAQQKAADCLQDRLQIPSDILADAKLPEGHHLYKITVATWYVFGKLVEGEGGKKYELTWNGGQR